MEIKGQHFSNMRTHTVVYVDDIVAADVKPANVVLAGVDHADWTEAQVAFFVKAQTELRRRILASPPPPMPPATAGKLLALLADPQMGEALLGDLDEKFSDLAVRFGPRFASKWYWWQALRSLGFLAVKWVWRIMKLEAVVRRLL